MFLHFFQASLPLFQLEQCTRLLPRSSLSSRSSILSWEFNVEPASLYHSWGFSRMSHFSFEKISLDIFLKPNSSVSWYKMYRVALSFTYVSFNASNWAFDQFVVLTDSSNPFLTTFQFFWVKKSLHSNSNYHNWPPLST